MPYSEIRLSTHAFVPKEELKATSESIIESLTIYSRYEENLKIDLSKETETHFGYPLYMRDYAQFTENLIDERYLGHDIIVNMADSFKLRDNQVQVINNFCYQLEHGRTGWLINMPTGSGKTVCACCMLQIIGKTTLIIVPREHLMTQWRDRIIQFTDIKENEIGMAQQDICDFSDKKIVIGMIHSLAKDKYPQAFKEYFGLVIWDEVHVAAAQTFSQTLSIFAPRYRIGMSATLKRSDGLDGIYRWSIGQEILSIRKQTLVKPIVYMFSFVTAKKHTYVENIPNGQHRRGILISSLAKDKERNILIAKLIHKAASTGRRTVVFSERKEQLNTLKDLLISVHNIDQASINIFTGDTKGAERQAILANSQIILATYGVMSMGVDVPDLRAVVFATPQANIAQPIGRILRICDDALEPIVFDIVDKSYMDCSYWANSRTKYYTYTARAQILEA
ncbi:MAG: DEAD/DEAH box helicase [Desulfovibrionaceae bacterium]|nr:DEAD/DEAH box helicase [Desulfovibrionaceae bacterium]